jgi:hypothetical protein
MSKLRPECQKAMGLVLPDDTALFLIRDSVARRRCLIRGRLNDSQGLHCAMGAFFADNPKAIVHSDLLDEVATVNDSLPASATPHQRWKKVNEWLRFKIAAIAKASRSVRP